MQVPSLGKYGTAHDTIAIHTGSPPSLSRGPGGSVWWTTFGRRLPGLTRAVGEASRRRSRLAFADRGALGAAHVGRDRRRGARPDAVSARPRLAACPGRERRRDVLDGHELPRDGQVVEADPE